MAAEQVALRGPSQTVHGRGCAPVRRAAESGALQLWAYGRGPYPGAPLHPDSLPGLHSVGSAESCSEPGWLLDRRDPDGIEVLCVTDGTLAFWCGDREYELGAGSVTITRPWQPRRFAKSAPGRASACWFIIDVAAARPNQDWRWPPWLPIPAPDLNRLTQLLRHNETPVWQATAAVTRSVGRLERRLREPVSRPVARVALGIAQVLVELTDQLEGRQIELDPYLASTERMVEMFLGRLGDRLDEPWTLNRMAESCGLGRTRFVHYCKRATGVSPQEYLAELRLARAADMLHTTDLTVAQIALQCGFQTSQYFSTVFRRRFGVSPGASRTEGVPDHVS